MVGLATSLSPIVAQSCFNVLNVHTEVTLFLFLFLIRRVGERGAYRAAECARDILGVYASRETRFGISGQQRGGVGGCNTRLYRQAASRDAGSLAWDLCVYARERWCSGTERLARRVSAMEAFRQQVMGKLFQSCHDACPTHCSRDETSRALTTRCAHQLPGPFLLRGTQEF